MDRPESARLVDRQVAFRPGARHQFLRHRDTSRSVWEPYHEVQILYAACFAGTGLTRGFLRPRTVLSRRRYLELHAGSGAIVAGAGGPAGGDPGGAVSDCVRKQGMEREQADRLGCPTRLIYCPAFTASERTRMSG